MFSSARCPRAEQTELRTRLGTPRCEEPPEGVVGIARVGQESPEARCRQRHEEREEQDEGHGSNSAVIEMLPRLT